MDSTEITNDNILSIEEHPDYPQDTNTEVAVSDEDQPAFGVHVVMMPNGEFAIQATGQPNLGEMQMILSRALKSVEARMVAETVVQLQQQAANTKRIITPSRP